MSAPTITVAHLKALAMECLERRIQADAIEADGCLSTLDSFFSQGDASDIAAELKRAHRAASERAFAAAAELEAIKAFQP